METAMFREEMSKLKSQADKDTFEKAYIGMLAVLESTNGGDAIVIVRAMWAAFVSEHRTLQQSFVRTLVEMLKVFGQKEKAAVSDARNEQSYLFAKRVAEMEDLYFPLV